MCPIKHLIGHRLFLQFITFQLENVSIMFNICIHFFFLNLVMRVFLTSDFFLGLSGAPDLKILSMQPIVPSDLSTIITGTTWSSAYVSLEISWFSQSQRSWLAHLKRFCIFIIPVMTCSFGICVCILYLPELWCILIFFILKSINFFLLIFIFLT